MKIMADIKSKLVSTSVVGWKNTASTIALLIMCGSTVAVFGYLCFSMPAFQCHLNYFYLSILWLIAEYTVIGYLYWYKDIPTFAREALVFFILIANIWLILFIFGLKECTV